MYVSHGGQSPAYSQGPSPQRLLTWVTSNAGGWGGGGEEWSRDLGELDPSHLLCKGGPPSSGAPLASMGPASGWVRGTLATEEPVMGDWIPWGLQKVQPLNL